MNIKDYSTIQLYKQEPPPPFIVDTTNRALRKWAIELVYGQRTGDTPETLIAQATKLVEFVQTEPTPSIPSSGES